MRLEPKRTSLIFVDLNASSPILETAFGRYIGPLSPLERKHLVGIEDRLDSAFAFDSEEKFVTVVRDEQLSNAWSPSELSDVGNVMLVMLVL